jgi:hypothetical protein
MWPCGSTQTHSGQVFYRRSLSRHCVFWELKRDCGTAAGLQQQELVTILCKREFLSEEAMARVREVRAGDVVCCSGTSSREEGSTFLLAEGAPQTPLLRLESFSLVARWAERHPTLTYSRFALDLPPCAPELLAPPASSPSDEANVSGVTTVPSLWAASKRQAAAAAPPPSSAEVLEEAFFEGVPLHRLCMHWVTGEYGCQRTHCPLLHGAGTEQPVSSMGALKFAFGRWRQRNKAALGRALEKALDARHSALGAPPLVAPARVAQGHNAPHSSEGEREGCGEGLGAGAGGARACHSQRALALVEHLLRSAPPGALEGGCILDVAGGVGDVGLLLALCGLRVLTVDPRARPMPYRRRKRLMSGFERMALPALCKQRRGGCPADGGGGGEGGGGGGGPAAGVSAGGKEAALHGDLAALAVASEGEEEEEEPRGEGGEQRLLLHPSSPLPPFIPPGMVAELFGAGHFAPPPASTVAFILGFHPDQATEPILNWALEERAPFFIVPCCVMGKEAPAPRYLDGAPVTSYEAFFTFLVEKARRAGCPVQIARLGITGRNAALFCWERGW